MKVTIEDLKKLNFDGDRENMVMTTTDRKEIESYFENDADALDEIENIENVALTIHAHADYDTGFATGFAYGYGKYEGRDLDTPNGDDYDGVIEWLNGFYDTIDDYGPGCCFSGRMRHGGGSRYYCDYCGKDEIMKSSRLTVTDCK